MKPGQVLLQEDFSPVLAEPLPRSELRSHPGTSLMILSPPLPISRRTLSNLTLIPDSAKLLDPRRSRLVSCSLFSATQNMERCDVGGICSETNCGLYH